MKLTESLREIIVILLSTYANQKLKLTPDSQRKIILFHFSGLIEPNEAELTLHHHKVRTASVPNSPQKIYRLFLHFLSALH